MLWCNDSCSDTSHRRELAPQLRLDEGYSQMGWVDLAYQWTLQSRNKKEEKRW